MAVVIILYRTFVLNLNFNCAIVFYLFLLLSASRWEFVYNFILLFFFSYYNFRYWTLHIMIAFVILCVCECANVGPMSVLKSVHMLYVGNSIFNFCFPCFSPSNDPVHTLSSFHSRPIGWGGKISIKFNCWTCYKIDIMLIESGYNLWWCEVFFSLWTIYYRFM